LNLLRCFSVSSRSFFFSVDDFPLSGERPGPHPVSFPFFLSFEYSLHYKLPLSPFLTDPPPGLLSDLQKKDPPENSGFAVIPPNIPHAAPYLISLCRLPKLFSLHLICLGQSRLFFLLTAKHCLDWFAYPFAGSAFPYQPLEVFGDRKNSPLVVAINSLRFFLTGFSPNRPLSLVTNQRPPPFPLKTHEKPFNCNVFFHFCIGFPSSLFFLTVSPFGYLSH